MSSPVDTRFRCPGENYFIERSIHLARLSGGFAACRECAHRTDASSRTSALTPLAGPTWGPSPELIGPEGPAGTALNEIDVAWVRQFSSAFGAVLRFGGDSPLRAAAQTDVPRVALGGDGRWLTAQFVAAASKGLGRSGCRVVETGASTAGSLAFLITRHTLDGGLLVGNSGGARQTVSLKCWGPAARPWSGGGTLDRICEILAGNLARAGRRFGGLERLDVGAEYRNRFADLFHGLRPLRYVLDTVSTPLAENLRHLASSSACELIGPRLPPIGTLAQPTGRKTRLLAAAPGTPPAAAVRNRRLQRLRAQVVADGAHFGLWIDGDGDTLELVDEQGRQVSLDRLLLALVRRLPTGARTAVVLESDASRAVRQQFPLDRVKLVESPSSREAMHAAMCRSGAILGGGPSGRLWFGGEPPLCDALWAVGHLLQLLSQADRPLSDAIG